MANFKVFSDSTLYSRLKYGEVSTTVLGSSKYTDSEKLSISVMERDERYDGPGWNLFQLKFHKNNNNVFRERNGYYTYIGNLPRKLVCTISLRYILMQSFSNSFLSGRDKPTIINVSVRKNLTECYKYKTSIEEHNLEEFTSDSQRVVRSNTSFMIEVDKFDVIYFCVDLMKNDPSSSAMMKAHFPLIIKKDSYIKFKTLMF